MRLRFIGQQDIAEKICVGIFCPYIISNALEYLKLISGYIEL